MAPRKKPVRALRSNMTLSLGPATIEALARIADASGVAQSRIVDAAVTHSPDCACDACIALVDDRAARVR